MFFQRSLDFCTFTFYVEFFLFTNKKKKQIIKYLRDYRAQRNPMLLLVEDGASFRCKEKAPVLPPYQFPPR